MDTSTPSKTPRATVFDSTPGDGCLWRGVDTWFVKRAGKVVARFGTRREARDHRDKLNTPATPAELCKRCGNPDGMVCDRCEVPAV